MPGEVDAHVAQAVASKLDAGTQWLLRREIERLPHLLPVGEEILHMAQGRHEGATGLIVATDSRLMFIEQGPSHQRVEDLPYAIVSSVQAEVNVVASKLMISRMEGEVTISRVYPKDRTMQIADYVRGRIAAPGDVGHSLGGPPHRD